MKYFLATILLSVAFSNAFAQFDKWFADKSLRIDYFHTGNAGYEMYSMSNLRAEPFWAGSKVHLIDSFNYGNYYVKVYDIKSNTLIYSRGYCTLFDEWQFTEEAKQTSRTFTETVIIPYPKDKVLVEFYSRDNKGIYNKKFDYQVDPANHFISTERSMVYPVYDIQLKGDPSKSIDIVILPEGYTASELDLFKKDCENFSRELFQFHPYNEYRNKFNIRAVLAPSAESGTDIPADKVWKNTIMNSSFYTFDSERYLMSPDHVSIRNLAANAPYDQIYILVNSSKYGGGAIYNFYSVSVNSNHSAAKIFVHEFGHGFAALADEYDDGSTSYNDMYPLGTEPWEPNITTLVNFDSKWKNMLQPGTPIPTPADPQNPYKTGVYEGAGYVANGIYRPATDCLMRTFKGNTFCNVCDKAIRRMIEFYCE